MDASVEYNEEDVSSADSKENENGDDVSVLLDFSEGNLNRHLLQKSNQIQVMLDYESENSMVPETKSMTHGQDPGAPKLETSFCNGVKSSNATIRRQSPSRKGPPTVKQIRSSTPTSRAAITTATKPMAPIKRSTTPTPRLSILPAAKSASRSSTPTPQPSKIPAAKSASRSSTPTQRTTILSASKSRSRSRSSTPIQRPSIVSTAKSASRSSATTARPSNPSVKSRGESPTVKSRPSKNPPEMLVTKTNLKAVPKRTSCSPSRRMVSNGGGNNTVKYENDDDVNPVLMGTKMVERVVNMRKLAPPKQDHISPYNNMLVSQENSGFGRSLSKKSFDMAMRHLDIRPSMPGNMRAMITKIPASSMYSVRPESTKSEQSMLQTRSLTTTSSENGPSYHE